MDWFIGHLIGDYLFQNDWQASNKKKSSIACGVHVVLYTFAIYITTFWPWWALLIVASLHFIQDRTNFVVWFMHVKGQKQFAQPPLAPWSIIVIDNVLHLVVLWLIASFIV